MPPSHFFAFFPAFNGSTAPSERIAKTFYKRLLTGEASCPLPVPAAANLRKQNRMDAPPAYWVKVSEAVFVPSSYGEQVTKALLDAVVDCLLRCGVSLVDAPAKVLESMISCRGGPGAKEAAKGSARVPLTVLTPAWLRQRLRSDGAMKSQALNKTAGGIFSQLSPTDVADLLEFATSDGNVTDLAGVPLLMCEDETAVHCFSASGQAVFFPRNALERRLFPNKDGRKLVLATKFEERPVLWAKFKKMAHTDAEAADAGPKFQINMLTFQKLVKALQMLLPRTWNNPAPRVPLSEYSEWVEDWLQAMWKWLEDGEVDMFQMVHWPLIPSKSDGSVELIRIPEPHKLVLFSALRSNTAGYPEAQEDEPLKRAQDLLESRLHGRPVREPSWFSHHEALLRKCVHAATVDGALKTMHYAARTISACQKEKISPSEALQMSLSKLNLEDVRALLHIAATAQKDGCICMTRSSWKSSCEVLRGLPFLCRFNQPLRHIALAEGISVLPETCPEFLVALRAAQVDLPRCAEIPGDVLSSMTQVERAAVASLLRELDPPRLRWGDLLVKQIFPWASDKTKDAAVRQGLMRAVVYHWRDMELTNQSACCWA